MTTTRMHVAVVDIGRLDNLGWAVGGRQSRPQIWAELTIVSKLLVARSPMARWHSDLKRQCFVPYCEDTNQLDRCRNGKGDRSFSGSPATRRARRVRNGRRQWGLRLAKTLTKLSFYQHSGA